jgi:hypothetical protein
LSFVLRRLRPRLLSPSLPFKYGHIMHMNIRIHTEIHTWKHTHTHTQTHIHTHTDTHTHAHSV